MNAPIALPRLMTGEELLTLPDDGMERWLIRGQLREKPKTYRNRWHSQTEAQIAYFLKAWARQLPRPRGQVLSGEAGCRLRRDPETVVGIDVMYISAELAARTPANTTLIEGAPILAVEILSPSDTVEGINEKLDDYLEAGVALVWIVDPYKQTVTVHRPDGDPELFNVRQELSGEPHLPGFRVAVADLFED